jgi:hypothetical protein
VGGLYTVVHQHNAATNDHQCSINGLPVPPSQPPMHLWMIAACTSTPMTEA